MTAVLMTQFGALVYMAASAGHGGYEPNGKYSFYDQIGIDME